MLLSYDMQHDIVDYMIMQTDVGAVNAVCVAVRLADVTPLT